MKKLNLLVMPLMAVSFLVSCNNGGGDKPTEVKFSLSSDHPIEVVDKTATVYVDWTPNDVIKFSPFTFTADPVKKNVTSFTQTDDPRPMPVTITFDEDITEDISGTLSFKYEDVTAKTKGESSISVTIPKPEEDPTLTKEEFDKAISFEGVQYLQVKEDIEIEPSMTFSKVLELSPSVSHVVVDMMQEEEYCRKNETDPVTYDRCFKDPNTGGEWGFTYNVDARYFMTPQNYWFGNFENPLFATIKELLGDDYYSDFVYVKEEGVYKAEFNDGTITLKFDNKKVDSYVFDMESEEYYDTTGVLTYEEKTPEYPKNPIVSEDEFNTACGLEGVKLLQVAQRTVTNSGEGDYIQDTNIEISDLVYYMSQGTDAEGEMYDYFLEMYSKINQLGDTTCTYTTRYSWETDWSTPETGDAQQYCIRPENCNPLLIKDMTLYECNPSLTYDNFEPIDGKYIYTGKASYFSGTPYDASMELTFNHKKLTHCLFTVDNDDQYRFECTYKYENITPVWPL